MTNPTGVHELHKNLATTFVNSIGDQVPTPYLLFVVEPRNPGISQAIG
jgi:hypothetical protein